MSFKSKNKECGKSMIRLLSDIRSDGRVNVRQSLNLTFRDDCDGPLWCISFVREATGLKTQTRLVEICVKCGTFQSQSVTLPSDGREGPFFFECRSRLMLHCCQRKSLRASASVSGKCSFVNLTTRFSPDSIQAAVNSPQARDAQGCRK